MRGAEKGRVSLPERVAQAYYTHGVFCATHPALVIISAVSLVLLSCIPLVNLPLPSNVPQIFVENNNISVETPKWFLDPPVYIQQVILKSAVSPWKEDLYLTDAIRAPLAEVFHLIETIQNYQHKSGTTLGDICVRVEEPNKPSPLPQYNCLLVSPANFWHQDPNQFYSDINLVSTIYKNQDVLIGKVSLSELLFGMSLREAGMKRYPLRNRQRVIQFAVTFILQKYDKLYMEGLHDHLKSHYPLNSENSSSSYQPHNILHLYYPGDFDFHEFLPLFFTYLMLFFYMYFSVRKIELVRSKVGMALSAVFTVISSLLMSIGLCLFFGLDPAGSSRGREVFPYLVVVVGLENIIVLTKSVVSTQPHLDSKIRIAQGLSKEGWSITKNLLTEVTILTIGLFTLVPAIQEFCIFATVGLLCDFFLQMFFFATVLSLDIRGIEVETDRQIPHLRDSSSMKPNSLVRSRSTPRLEYPNPMISDKPHDKIPKRLKLVHFWARTRIVQRAFMLCMVFWIGGFIYSAGIIHHLVPDGQMQHFSSNRILGGFRSPLKMPKDSDLLAQHDVRFNSSDKQGRVLSTVPCAKPLSPIKWCHLVMMYNATTGPCRLTLLPPLRLNSVIAPRRAIALRNPQEPKEKPFKWHSLANALDSSDFSVSDSDIDYALTLRGWESPFLPTSPLEVLLVTALCVISILVISYTALALYHCVCSRNYAQWRSGWTAETAGETTQVVLQAMPLILEGQGQCVEAISSDGNSIVCSCLTGDINVWDAFSGEPLVHINRKLHFSRGPKEREGSSESCPSSPLGSPYQRWDVAGSPRSEMSVDSTFPSLSGIINTRFSQNSSLSPESSLDYSSRGFDYGPALRHLYFENEVCGNCSHEDINNSDSLYANCPQVWCIDCVENLIAVGTSTGQIEFWEASSGCFKCAFNDGCGVGVTCVKLAFGRLVVCRLNGSLEVFSISWSSQPLQHSFKRSDMRSSGGHIRAQSAGRLEDTNVDLMCHRVSGLRAHQQPITVLLVESGRIVTGSHDHTLKVWSFPDQLLVFTLHGHCGPLTCLFIDSENPMTAGSGSQEGTLCVWDLLTGACVFSLDAHDGPVVALTYSISYVISLGGDERICVWDRFQGHLLNTIQVPQTFCTSICMLTHNLLITSRQGSLVIWNVRSGEPVRLIKLGNCDETTFVRTILPLRDSIACDYGNELRVVRFPLVREKTD